MIASCAGSCFGSGKVGGVGVDVEDHVAGDESDDGIGMGCAVVEELRESCHGSLGAVGLLGGKRADGGEEGRIDGSGVEEEGSEDFLHAFGVFGVKGGRGVGSRGVLRFGSVVGLLPGVRSVLGPCRGWMLEALEGAFDVPWHGNVTGTVDVVPLDCEAAILASFPVFGDFVELVEGEQQVVHVGFVGVFNTEVVDHKGEGKGAGGVFPQAGSERNRCVPMRCQVLDEAVVGDAAGLGKAVHAFPNFDVDVSIVDKGGEVVLGHDGVGDDGDWDAHVGVVLGLHRRVQVEILEVAGHEAGVLCGDDAVQDGLDGGEIGRFGADVAVVVDAVAADGEADAVGVAFFGAVGGNDSEVRRFDVFWHFGDRDEEHGVGAGSHVFAVALGEAADFIGAGGDPDWTVTAIAEFGVFGDLARVGVEGVAVEGGMVEEGEELGGEGFFGGGGNAAGVGTRSMRVGGWFGGLGGRVGRCAVFGSGLPGSTAAAAAGGTGAVIEGVGLRRRLVVWPGRRGCDGDRKRDSFGGGSGRRWRRWRRGRRVHPQRWDRGLHPQRLGRRVGGRWEGGRCGC